MYLILKINVDVNSSKNPGERRLSFWWLHEYF